MNSQILNINCIYFLFTADIQFKVKGDMKIGGQYHFVMENLACYTVPLDDGLDVYSTSQWIQSTHEAIAVALGIPENK